MKKFLILGVTLVGIAIVGVLGYGLVVEEIIKAREPVAIVGDTPITTAEFQARVRFTRMQMRNELRYWYQQQQMIDPTAPESEFYLEYIQGRIRDVQTKLSPDEAVTVGEQALNQLIQEELARREAQHRGITVTPGEVQREVEAAFGYDRNSAAPLPTVLPPLTSTIAVTSTPEAEPRPTPTRMTEQDFRQLYTTYLRESLRPLGISEQQYRSWTESALLVEKLRDHMGEEVPTRADQVKLRMLTVDSEERANQLAARLDAGAGFQTLADELEEEEAGYGRELGWLPSDLLESRLGGEFADLAFSLEVGQHSQPILGQSGEQYTVVEVAGHEVRELGQAVRQQLEEETFQAWLQAQQVLVERKTYTDRVPTEP